MNCICDFLDRKSGVAYYFPKDRKQIEPGYNKFHYNWLFIPTKAIGVTEIIVKGNIQKLLKLLNSWNSRDSYNWYYFA